MPADKLKADMLTTFLGGELTPALAGRVDRQETKIGTRFLSNFMPEVQGGLKKFYGSNFVSVLSSAVNGDEYRIIPFDGASEPLALVFVSNKAYIATSSEFYEQPGLSLSSAMMRDCSYLQINDTIFVASEGNNQFEIRYLGVINDKHSFAYYNSEFVDVPYFPIGWTGNFYGTITSAGATGRIKLTAGEVRSVYELALPSVLTGLASSRNVTFADNPDMCITKGRNTSSTTSAVPATFGESVLSLHRVRNGEDTVILTATIGQVVEGGNAVKSSGGIVNPTIRSSTIGKLGSVITSPSYGGGWWAYKSITYQQVSNALSSQLGNVSVSSGTGTKLIFNRLPDNNEDGDAYYISFSQGESSCSDPTASTSWPDTPTGSVPPLALSAPAYSQSGMSSVLVAQTATFDDVELNGRRIKFWLPDDDNAPTVRAWAQGATYSNNEIVYSDGHYYRMASVDGTAGSIQPIHVNGYRSDGNLRWQYLHSGYGTGVITSVPDNKTMYIQVDGHLPILEYGKSSYKWTNYQWSMWGYKNTFPSKVFSYKGRLGYIFNAPGWGSFLQFSKTDQYNDFGTEDYGQQLDTSAINVQITGHQDNRINWVLPGYRLYMGSYSGEYNVRGSSSGAISPTACYILPVSSIGGAPVDALKYEELNMFVGRLSTSVYSLRYDYTTDDYSPDNIGFAGSDLMEEGVARLQALKNDDNNVYFKTLRNNLRLIHNNKEVNLLAFARTNLMGEALDIASSNSKYRSVMFVLVRRGDFVSVETISAESTPYMLSARGFYYDSDEDVPETVTVPELAGFKVYVCGGTPMRFYHLVVPKSGVIPINYKWHNIVIGIAMPCEAHLSPAVGEKLEGLQQKSVRFIVRLFESGAFSYGSSNDFDKWYEYNNWSVQDGQKWDTSHQLLTGDFQLPSPFGYAVGQNASTRYPNSTGVGLNIFSDTPEPFNLLLVSNLYV